MRVFIYLGCVLSVWVVGAQGVCRDIDHQGCQLMKTQNPEICFDPAISSTACPKFCQKCAITCYVCEDASSPNECNTTQTCQVGEVCMTQTSLSSDGSTIYNYSCANSQLCNGNQSSQCCSDDLCNHPQISTTTTMPTTKTTTTMPTTSTTTTTTTPIPPTTSPKNNCARDLIFVVDESTTMALVFPTITQFISNLVDRQVIGSSDTMVSMTTFAVLAHKRWDLNRYTNKQQLLGAIQSMTPNLAGISDSLSGLSYVINHVVLSRFGDRPDVPDDVIFISDGSWHRNFLSFITGKNDQITVVNELHQKSHNVISIGVGPANQAMINSVATDSAHSILVHAASDLLSTSIQSHVLNLICQN